MVESITNKGYLTKIELSSLNKLFNGLTSLLSQFILKQQNPKHILVKSKKQPLHIKPKNNPYRNFKLLEPFDFSIRSITIRI